MNKIYIVGNVGSGKTTLALKLSKDLKIKNYELDSLVWDNNKIATRRTNEEILTLFNKIISKDKWIIEDPGRDIFKGGINKADLVILLDIPFYIIKIRLLKRWIKQVLRIEKCNYKPSINMLFKMYKWARKNNRNRDNYILFLKSNAKKLLILNEKDINNFDIRRYYENI